MWAERAEYYHIFANEVSCLINTPWIYLTKGKIVLNRLHFEGFFYSEYDAISAAKAFWPHKKIEIYKIAKKPVGVPLSELKYRKGDFILAALKRPSSFTGNDFLPATIMDINYAKNRVSIQWENGWFARINPNEIITKNEFKF